MTSRMASKHIDTHQDKNHLKALGSMEKKKESGPSGLRMDRLKVRSHTKVISGMEATPTGMKMVKK